MACQLHGMLAQINWKLHVAAVCHMSTVLCVTAAKPCTCSHPPSGSAAIADTIANPSVTTLLDPGRVDPPTLAMVRAAWAVARWGSCAGGAGAMCTLPRALKCRKHELRQLQFAPEQTYLTAQHRPAAHAQVFGPNDSPLAGRAGKALTGRAIGERLQVSDCNVCCAGGSRFAHLRCKFELGRNSARLDLETPAWRHPCMPPIAVAQAEAETSVSLRVGPAADGSGSERYEVQARGELQLGVLIESMRREGAELAVSPPQVLLR